MSDFLDTEGPQRKKKRRSRSRNKKQRSLSPLSKRMALIEPSLDKSHNSQFNHPYGWAGGAPPPPEPEPPVLIIPQPPAPQDLDYEMKVRIKITRKIWRHDQVQQLLESDHHVKSR